jgi:hypothetical protein
LSEELRGVVEWGDGVTWDVAKRREAFEDTDLGGGDRVIDGGAVDRVGELRIREWLLNYRGCHLLLFNNHRCLLFY